MQRMRAVAKPTNYDTLTITMADDRKQQPPKAVRPNKDKESRGGYDCEFVEAPPKVLQTECSICLLILKEPCLISCCGHKFCRGCIEQVEKSKKPCPLCNTPDFTFLPERALQRSLLNDFEVYCSYKKDGCDWKRRLGELVGHLNKDSVPEIQPKEWQFVEVECGNKCGEWFHRQDVITHKIIHCKKRPYSCEYCRKYNSTFEDVTKIHYSQCSKYLVACPNACQVVRLERQELESHLQDHCPLAKVDCPFNYADCQTRLLRKDMPKHMEESVTHLTMLASFTQKLASVTQKLEKENQELQQSLAEKEQKLHAIEEMFGISIPIEFHVKWPSDDCVLPGFYTHPHGYQMCVEVCPNGNGDGKGSHVSIFTCLMKGPFDEYLKWPFRGEVTIQIVNQAGGHDHKEMIIPYTDETPKIKAGRVSSKDQSKAWGYSKFLDHTTLQNNTTENIQYLKDDHFIVRVVKMKVM